MSIPRKHKERGVPIHPGEFLREDFLVPLGLSANALAIVWALVITCCWYRTKSGCAAS